MSLSNCVAVSVSVSLIFSTMVLIVRVKFRLAQWINMIMTLIVMKTTVSNPIISNASKMPHVVSWRDSGGSVAAVRGNLLVPWASAEAAIAFLAAA